MEDWPGFFINHVIQSKWSFLRNKINAIKQIEANFADSLLSKGLVYSSIGIEMRATTDYALNKQVPTERV